MARLLDDLLDISRITRNKLDLRREQVELAAVLDIAVEASRPLLEQRSQELTITLPPEPVRLHADPTRLGQVLLNLLNNAAKYTQNGGRIGVCAQRQGGDVVIAIKDNGIGIGADHLPRLFEMFSQAAPTQERSYDGLGIGLFLVRGLVELHGGKVEARSDGLGKGSEFLVRLPLAVPKPMQQPYRPREDAQVYPTRFRILVVDDLRDSADSLAVLLRLVGNEVCTAYDGQEALETAAEFRPDVVVLDLGMPKLNGYDTCRRLREQAWTKDVVFVALTGWGQEEDRRRTEEAGFHYHLVKPIDPAAFMKLLAKLQPAATV
jgi:CheY-like chemotaxis protein/two-component sensor histidine kinase